MKVSTLFALALFAILLGNPGSAAAADTYTCIASVATQGGIQVLGQQTVSGSPIAVAASACHDYTRKAFALNKDWSDPEKVCARYPSSTSRTVEALDYFKELGHSAGYNRVDGFTVTCNGAKDVQHLPTAPTVIQR